MNTSNLQQYIAESKQIIDVDLEGFFAQRLQRAKQLDSSYYELVEQTAKVAMQGGKRLRPALAMLGYKLAGGKDMAKMQKAALALEIFHNFLLIHDDIMDRDDTRHGGKNVSGTYFDKLQVSISQEDARHTATSFAILAGDISCGFTYEALLDAEFSAQHTLAAVSRLNEAIFEVGAGQYLDVLGAYSKALSLKQIEAINIHKTADYSVVLPLQFGAILAGSNQELSDQFAQYGKNTGIAFQLSDDIIGIYGNSKDTGKPVGTDIAQSKQTLLMHYGLELASTAQKKILQSKLGLSNLSNDDIEQVRSILTKNGAKAKVESIAQSLANQACEQVSLMHTTDTSKQLLVEFAQYCVMRMN